MSTQRPLILLSEDYPIWCQTLLQTELAEFETLKVRHSDIMTGEYLNKNAKAFLVRSTTRIDEKLLKLLPDLKIIGTATSGFDHFDLDLLKENDILAFHTPNTNAEPTADLTLWHILSALRNLNTVGFADLKWRQDLGRGRNAKGLSLGIVGMGRIGRKVARRALAFGLKVFYHDPYLDVHELKSETDFNINEVESLGLMELFSHCDIVSLHTPLTQKTRGFINARTLDHFGLNKILINCARGELIRGSDLIQALDSDILAAAGLDTFEQEPLDALSAIRTHRKITWTPHIGAYTSEAFDESCREAALQLCGILMHGHGPKYPLPPKTLWAQDL